MRGERAVVVAVALSCAACTVRDVVVDVYTPDVCCLGAGCVEPECPLSHVRCIETTLERPDGTDAFVERLPAPEGLCTVADLAGFVFLERVMQPADAVEVRVEGRRAEDCTGELVLACESFGEHVVDLERDSRIAIWCDCPYGPPP
ncbi:MAG TPA: hypothetical protein VIL20_08715 [Sandaracinaceae bacterium]